MPDGKTEQKKTWADCEKCGAENCVMVCHVERLHGEDQFFYRGALDEPFRGIAEVAEGGLGVACAECGHCEHGRGLLDESK